MPLLRPRAVVFGLLVAAIFAVRTEGAPIGSATLDDAFKFAGDRFNLAIDGTSIADGTLTTAEYLVSTRTTADATQGKWDSGNAGGWTSGFWPGCLWQMYAKTGDAAWAARAKDWTAGIAGQATNGADHDIGFRIMSGFGNQYRYSPNAADRAAALSTITTAAGTLDTRFNKPYNSVPVPANAIRSWDNIEGQYPVCIDNMMNLELLLFAYRENGKQASQKVWYDNAVAHANTSIAQHLRGGGGTYHVVRHFDGSKTSDPLLLGTVERKNTRQGFGDETTWSRGQAWAIYGFTTVYDHTKDDPSASPQNFFSAAKATADYFIAHLPHYYAADPYNHKTGDFVPPTDFDAALGEPAGPWCDANNNGIPNETNGGTGYLNDRKLATGAFTARDSSAAAIAAAGLLRLSTLTPDQGDRAKYQQAGEDILDSLLTYTGSDATLDYLAKDSVHMGLLAEASSYYGAPTQSLIYGDYYLLEAMRTYEAISVPEPGILVMLALLAGMAVLLRRQLLFR
jgi:hypothetical protein